MTKVVEAVFAEPEVSEDISIATPLKALPNGGADVEWEPFGNPKQFSLAKIDVSC